MSLHSVSLPNHPLSTLFIVLALAAMFGVGASIGALNGRNAIRSGFRQILAGALAAAVTFGVGHLIGANLS